MDTDYRLGIAEFDDAKLADLLVLKYHAVADAKHALGDIQSIRNIFIGFQTHSYEKIVA